MGGDLTLVDQAPAAHAALSPLRLEILRSLDAPASATELAAGLGLTRQKVNYHLGVLETHGLVAVVEERQRRGFRERVFERGGNVVLAPDLLATGNNRDAMSAAAAVAAASDVIRTVGHLSTAARTEEKHLVTATIVTDVAFATPADLEAFLEGVAALAAHFDAGPADDGHRMRVTLVSHPVPEQRSTP